MLEKSLDLLLTQNCYIHIIDNTLDNECKKYCSSPRLKVTHFNQRFNVNESWNLGLKQATTDYYLLLNDDCLIWDRVISKGEKIIQDPTIGLVTFRSLDNLHPDLYSRLFKGQNHPPNLQDLGAEHKLKFERIGWFIFGRRSEWQNIPAPIKLFFGDDFIYQMARKNGQRTVIDLAHYIWHQHNTTIKLTLDKEKFTEIFEREKSAFAAIIEQYQLPGISSHKT